VKLENNFCTSQIFIYAYLSHLGPTPFTWNALPDNIRTVADSAKFRKRLKSHYFSVAFNIR